MVSVWQPNSQDAIPRTKNNDFILNEKTCQMVFYSADSTNEKGRTIVVEFWICTTTKV